nr:hypothetical protein [Tanacetum cinerariifolium]
DDKDDEEEGNGADDLGLNVGGEERHIEEEEKDEIYRDVNINQGKGLQASLELEDSRVTLTPVNPNGQQQSSLVSLQFVTSMLNPTLDVGMESIFETTSQLNVQPPTFVAPLSILRSLEANFSKAMQMNQFAGAVSAISWIVQQYMDQRMNEAVKVAIQIQSDRLRDEAQRDNDEFLKTFDENMKKIIKEQVKKQVKVQVSKILPRIEQAVNEQLEAEVLTRSSHSSKTSYVVAADLSKMELKKILIEKIEGNKSIQRSDEQRNLYKALVEAYKSDKIILDTYRETVTLKRRRDDDVDKDEEPFAGPNRGSKRRREEKESESASAPIETATRSVGRSTQGFRSRQASASESALAEEPMQTTSQMEEPSHPEFDTGAEDQPIISELTKQADTRSSFNELMDNPLDFSNFLINWLKVDTLTPELLAGPTYELMKGSCKSLVELEYHLEEVFKATTDQLDWVNPEGQQYPHNLLKPLPLIPNNQGRRVIPFEHFINNDLEYLRGGASSLLGFAINQESARDVYSKRKIIAVTKLKIVEWHSYKHLDWITRHVEDLQLGVESYQKKLNLTKLDLYRSDLKCKEAYTAYSNPQGFIYQNKDKRNRLMRIDKLHKFSDGTLTDVRTALDDRLKGIQM